MKTLKIFSTSVMTMLFAVILSLPNNSFAQKTTTETLNVSGECGMCKKKIEKAAKEAGASYAVWSTSSKVLTVKYNSLSTNSAKIQQKIADAGYDTPKFKATNEAYNKLDECCQYQRTAGKNEMTDCCKDGKCDKQACKDAGCCSDGKCDMSICKEKGCCSNGKDMAADCCDKGAKGSKDCCSKSTGAKTTSNNSKSNKNRQ